MTEDKEDWIDRLVNRFGDWLDSLTEYDEPQDLGKWSYSIEKKDEASGSMSNQKTP